MRPLRQPLVRLPPGPDFRVHSSATVQLGKGVHGAAAPSAGYESLFGRVAGVGPQWKVLLELKLNLIASYHADDAAKIGITCMKR